jgi:hypothetical protein
LIYEGGKQAELRDANFRLLREVAVVGEPLSVEPGENEVRLSYSGDKGPAPWSRLECKCLGPAEEVVAR